MSIHPEPLVIDVKRDLSKDEPTQTFYFQSQSGKITTVKAKDKSSAVTSYRYNALPTLVVPSSSCFWTERLYCSQKYCVHSHIITRSTLHGNYIDIFHILLTKYPNCDILHRLKLMMDYRPTILEDDFQVVQENPDGTQIKQNPATSILHWKEANVTLKFPHYSLYKMSDKRQIFEDVFLKLLEKVDRTCSYIHLNLCYEILYLNLDKLTPDQIDKLSGSLEPTTEPPLRNEVVDAVGPVEVRKPSLFRRKRKQYEAIELTNIANC